MKPGKMALSVAAFMLGVTVLAADVTAAVLFRDSFEGSPRGRKALVGETTVTPNGIGLRAQQGGDDQTTFSGSIVDLDEAGIHREGGLPQGSLSLWVQRNEQQNWENLATFSAADYSLMARVMITWEGDSGNTELKIGSGEYPLWYLEYVDVGMNNYVGKTIVFPLDQKIAKGQWVNVTLTWGASDTERGIFVNGKKLAVKVDNNFAMQKLLADSQYLVIGSDPRPGSGITDASGLFAPGVVDSVTRSVIDAVEIRDTVVTDFPLVYVGDQQLLIADIDDDRRTAAGFSGKLIAGNRLGVTITGTPGARGTFDVVHYPDIGGNISLDWRGWGVYLEEKVFFEESEVNLREVEGYRVYAELESFAAITPEMVPVAELEVEEQSYAFSTLNPNTPYYIGVYAEMRDGSLRPVISPRVNVPMTESAPGVYQGSFTVGYQDRFERAVLAGRLAKGGAVASLADYDDPLVIDPRLTVAVATDPAELKADEMSMAKIAVTVTDANGNAVSGHKIRFLLATTSQYTGVVGGGKFKDEVGGTISQSEFDGVTDLFGKVSATYVAGFAAKTAIVVARDMTSNDTGAGWVKTFIEATAQIVLEEVSTAAAMEAGYQITVKSSDEWLTADGKSQARITARVTLGGQPVEGHAVNFDLSSTNGSLRSVKDVTDRNGEARAVYTAGKKIGIVLITATDTTAGISGSVQIELRSDAPAKIAITITPEKLPADGRSSAELLVLVTDVNDNPNENTEVEYFIIGGSGRLRDTKGLTDRRGESTSEYIAGRNPGVVSFKITVRSTVPSDEEIEKARGLALAVTDYSFF